ncbi:MAG: 30S ribosomal protein S5 [Candidatus Gracilibacteria bacterium]|nr:30S ribosomal protein S5 [Candidatus Gracilibacteria bacterium]MDD2908857.1 30S ribosomal protein S5 [Candidatus Gracilibacteria bacterium]
MTKEAPKKGGFRDAAPKEFKEELLQIDRVTRVTAGGRQLRFRASVVIGDGKGRVGLGIGKAGEVVVAIEKAVRDAKKNIIKFAIIDGTIAHNITADYKAASVMLHPASPGTGIIAGGAVRKIISVSGLRDILAKRYGSTNAITNARATLKALSLIKTNSEFSKKSIEEEVAVTETKTEVKTPVVETKVKEVAIEKTPVVEIETKETTKPVATKKVSAKKPTTKK